MLITSTEISRSAQQGVRGKVNHSISSLKPRSETTSLQYIERCLLGPQESQVRLNEGSSGLSTKNSNERLKRLNNTDDVGTSAYIIEQLTPLRENKSNSVVPAAKSFQMPEEKPTISQKRSEYDFNTGEERNVILGVQTLKGKEKPKTEMRDIKRLEVSPKSNLTKLYESVSPAAPATISYTGGRNVGALFSSQDTFLGQTAASKVVKRALPDGTIRAVKMCRHPDIVRAAQLWRAEVDILKPMNHASVIRLFNSEAAHLTLELELLPGGSLDKLVDEKLMCTISSRAIQSVWLNISEALEYIHGRGIIHCDIKPANILLRADHVGAVLCDFGNAIMNSAAKGSGTPCYVPPEALSGAWPNSGDVWALGVTMLYATRLLSLPNRSWIIAIVETDIKASREMRRWLKIIQETIEKIPKRHNLMRKMLEYDPEKRIVAGELVRNLRQQVHRRKSFEGSKTIKITQ